MGGAGFAGLTGSQPILLIQTQEMIVPDTGTLDVSGHAPTPLGEEAPTFQFVLTLRRSILYKTGM